MELYIAVMVGPADVAANMNFLNSLVLGETMSKLLLLFLIFSCTTPGPKTSEVLPPKEMEWSSNRDLWTGKSEELLGLHPIFATMPVESRKTSSGIETRRYTQGGAITSQDCKDNQCAGVSNTDACNHVFYVQKKIITNYHRVGNCGRENLQHRPLDRDGNPEYTAIEIVQAKEISEYNKIRDEQLAQNEARSCKSRSDCNDGKTCKILYSDTQSGMCVEHGLFGKLFNN